MNLDKQKAFIIHVIYIAMILGITYFSIKYFLPLLMPFVIGVFIAFAFRYPIDLIQSKFKIRRVIVAIIFLVFFYAVVGLLLSLIGFKVFNSIAELFYSLPALYDQTIEPVINTIADNLILHFPGIQTYVEEFLYDINDTIFSFVKTMSSTAVTSITGIAGQLPSLLIKFIFTIVASFFFTIDFYKIGDFIMKQFSGKGKDMVIKLRDNGLGTLGKFIKAYAIIITITFIELTLGFTILRVPNAITLAGLVALVDILPILGTGAILIPWSIISFILGNFKMGIGILLLYIIITVVRQAVEPKIIGQQIGLHPIITLLLMYVGAQLMGVLGLLILPIIATIIKTLNDEGTIHWFK